MFFSRSIDQDALIAHSKDYLSDFFSIKPDSWQADIRLTDEIVQIALPFAAHSRHSKLKHGLTRSLEVKGMEISGIDITTNIGRAVTQQKALPRVKNIIAVGSGKGGVGKSTTSVNLAYALKQEGAKVGLLDADIYGPSVPIMLGNPEAHPSSQDQKHMEPLQAAGIVANSIGYLVPPEKAAIWRGPMVSRALQQLVYETLWPELDYLVVDMPPGTGDIQLTLAQQVPVSAAVIVTTPQDLALADAIKGIAMFEKVDIPVLGLVENMSYYQCKNCGTKEAIFASDGGNKLAKQYDVDLLAALPLDIQIRQHADGGTPLLVAEPDSPLSESYREAARAVSRNLALKVALDQSSIPIVQKN